jgi:hypothetical protein
LEAASAPATVLAQGLGNDLNVFTLQLASIVPSRAFFGK